ncbi:MAG: hypothetical protein HY063_12205 [Bacteroidetes bacterium]|nr:hypothetical protein [Bacteroidota bacterium]
MAKKLDKKFKLTANFQNLTEEEKLKLESDMANAQASSGLVPGLNPSAGTVQNQIRAINDPVTGLITQRDAAIALEKNLTQQINDGITAIQNTIIDLWMPQTQAAISGNTATRAANAKTLKFGIKGQDTGHVSAATARTHAANTESHPVIEFIDKNVHNQHTLVIHDSHQKKFKLRPDVLRIDVYGVTSDTTPADLAALIKMGGGYLGQAGKRGKFVHEYTTDPAMKQTEQYIAVYISKATKKPIAESPAESAFMG